MRTDQNNHKPGKDRLKKKRGLWERGPFRFCFSSPVFSFSPLSFLSLSLFPRCALVLPFCLLSPLFSLPSLSLSLFVFSSLSPFSPFSPFFPSTPDTRSSYQDVPESCFTVVERRENDFRLQLHRCYTEGPKFHAQRWRWEFGQR